MKVRTPLHSYSALRDDLDGLITWRVLPALGLPHIEPFLFLNHHGFQVFPPHNEGLPFAPHPHRGFETVTLVLAGELVHTDSAGHQSAIHAGGVQWMTAGRGLIHSELSSEQFRRQGGELELIQLWVNLPAALKFCKPRYFGIEEPELPSLELDDGRVRAKVVAGPLLEERGPVPMLAAVHLALFQFETGGRLELPLPAAHEILFYCVKGELMVNSKLVKDRQLLSFAADGEMLIVQAISDAVLLLGHGPKQNEPIVAHGPFVMNTRQEVIQALRDYQEGKFE